MGGLLVLIGSGIFLIGTMIGYQTSKFIDHKSTDKQVLSVETEIASPTPTLIPTPTPTPSSTPYRKVSPSNE